MKMRKGFVSNSSSSSFVILLPEKFSIDDIDWSKYNMFINDETTKEESIKIVKESIKKIIQEKRLFEYGNYDSFNIIPEIFSDFIIAEIECGSDEGQIVLVDRDKVKKLIGG